MPNPGRLSADILGGGAVGSFVLTLSKYSDNPNLALRELALFGSGVCAELVDGWGGSGVCAELVDGCGGSGSRPVLVNNCGEGCGLASCIGATFRLGKPLLCWLADPSLDVLGIADVSTRDAACLLDDAAQGMLCGLSVG